MRRASQSYAEDNGGVPGILKSFRDMLSFLKARAKARLIYRGS